MITWVFVPLGLILPDQPNRVVRTRMLRGVGGALCEGRPYPDNVKWFKAYFMPFLLLLEELFFEN